MIRQHTQGRDGYQRRLGGAEGQPFVYALVCCKEQSGVASCVLSPILAMNTVAKMARKYFIFIDQISAGEAFPSARFRPPACYPIPAPPGDLCPPIAAPVHERTAPTAPRRSCGRSSG